MKSRAILVVLGLIASILSVDLSRNSFAVDGLVVILDNQFNYDSGTEYAPDLSYAGSCMLDTVFFPPVIDGFFALSFAHTTEPLTMVSFEGVLYTLGLNLNAYSVSVVGFRSLSEASQSFPGGAYGTLFNIPLTPGVDVFFITRSDGLLSFYANLNQPLSSGDVYVALSFRGTIEENGYAGLIKSTKPVVGGPSFYIANPNGNSAHGHAFAKIMGRRPSPTPTSTPTSEVPPNPTATATATSTATPTPSFTSTPTKTATATPTVSPTKSPTLIPTRTPTKPPRGLGTTKPQQPSMTRFTDSLSAYESTSDTNMGISSPNSALETPLR